jgi:hypothetical protein
MFDEKTGWQIVSSQELSGRSSRYDHKLFGPDGMVPALPRDFFEIRTSQLASGADVAEFTRELAEKWKIWHVNLTLRDVLGAETARWLSDAVEEIGRNAVQHPNASVVQTSSQLLKRRTGDNRLQLSIWDDGSSIIDTLRQPLERGERVLSPHFGSPSVSYEVVEHPVDGRPPESYTLSTEDVMDRLTAQSSWTFLLLAATMPGVSREAFRTTRPVTGEAPGWGLYRFLRQTVEGWGADVSIRTRSMLARFSPVTGLGSDTSLTSADFKARVDVWNFGDHELDVVGNQFVLDVPTRNFSVIQGSTT